MLAEVRSLGSPRRLRTPQELEDFEQELVDQYALAAVGAGITDNTVSEERSVLFAFIHFMGRPVWEAAPADVDAFLAAQRKRGLAKSTLACKACVLAAFFDFLIARYQSDIHALTGHVLIQPIDAFNRSFNTVGSGSSRVPPREQEVQTLFAGHTPLREISCDQVIAALPASGTPRVKLARGLRSIFTTLKARKMIFANPTARIHVGNFERRTPLRADTDRLGAALNSPNPATADLAALLIFHGLRPAELRDLRLTDIRDGRCQLLADPVRTRLAAYLDHRNRRWPNTLNPHFFVHRQITSATGQASRPWVNKGLGMPAGAIGQDRIIDEALATGGDLRRICDLFGVTIASAEHYTTVLNHPSLTAVGHNSNTPGCGSKRST